MWHSKHKPPGKSFGEILVDDGVCFTFNHLNAKELFTDELVNGITV